MQTDSMHAYVPVQWLDSLRASGKYDYHQGQAHLDLWEWFKRWLWEAFGSLFSTDQGLSVTSILFYAIILATLGLGVYWFMRGGASAPTGRASHQLDHASIAEEDLHEIDFDRRIGMAVAEGDLRLAIRYLYLQALHHLEQHAWIVIKSGKTNRDYERDVASLAVGSVFRVARLEFEQVWYGKHNVDHTEYERIRSVFTELQVKARRT